MNARALRPSSPARLRPVRRRAGVLCGCTTLAAGLFGATSAVQADPTADVARAPAELTALVVVPRRTEGLALHPEVSAARTTLSPPGPQAVAPDGRPMNELAGVQMRLWLSRGRTAFGVGVGTLGYLQPPLGRHDASATLAGATPTVSVGMRYRMTSDSAVFADASGARALPPDASAYVSTKVGMEWKPAASRFGFDGGALGIHFDSGYRLSVKARHDGLGVYLRGKF